jgi:hypothetical protein
MQPNQDNATGIKAILLRLSKLDEAGKPLPQLQDYMKNSKERKRQND